MLPRHFPPVGTSRQPLICLPLAYRTVQARFWTRGSMSEFDEDRQEGGSESQAPLDTPAATPAPAMREDQLQNAVAFLSHPKVTSEGASKARSCC